MSEDDQYVTDGEAPDQLRRLGKFQIVKKLGAGGMGTVFLATDTDLRRPVALKVMARDRAENPRLVRRFKAEAQAVASLRHDNIVAIYEAGELDGYPYLALEYVDGSDLHTLIQKRGPIPAKRSLKLVRQIAVALQHAFERNIVHRDIKPSNLLVTHEGVCKLTDLGLARSVDDTLDASITRAGTTVGTIDYIAPEQACDSKSADIRSDIYSLGCTWYHMLTGEPPYGEGDMQQKIRAHLNSPAPNPRQLNPHVPEAYVAVLQQMMAKKPDDRYQTPSQLVADLDQVADVARSLSAELFDEPATSERPDESASSKLFDDLPAAAPRVEASPGAASRPQETPASGRSPKQRRPAASTPQENSARPASAPARQEAVEDSAASPAISKKMKLSGKASEAPAESKPTSRRRAANSTTERENESDAAAEPKTRRLTAAERKTPTGVSIDLDFARIALVGAIVLAALGGFWWAMSRGSSWSSPAVVDLNPAPPPPPVAPGPEEPTPGEPVAPGPLRAEAEFLAGDPQTVSRIGYIFAGTDDLGAPDSASIRKFVPDWVYAIEQAPIEGLPTITVSQPAPVGGADNLNTALRRFRERQRVIELQGDGPFPLEPESFQNVDRLVIRAVEGSHPIVILQGSPTAEQGWLQLQGGVLELEGLHLLAASPAESTERALLSVAGGTIVLRSCTLTQGDDSGPLVLCRAVESTQNSFPSRVLVENSLIRGERLTVASCRGSHVDVVIGGSLLASGAGSMIEAELHGSTATHSAETAARSAAPPPATEPAAAAPAADASPAVAPSTESAPERRSAIRVLGSVIIAREGALQLRQPPGHSIAGLDVQLRRSILVGGPEAVLLALPEWPARGTSVSGQPRVANLHWQQERTQLADWPQLVQLGAAGVGAKIVSAENWRTFWAAPLETGSLTAGEALPADTALGRLGGAEGLALSRSVPPEISAGGQVGLAQELPTPPTAVIDKHLVLKGRPQLPVGFVELSPPAGPIVRVDLRGLKTSLHDFLNSEAVPDGAHVQLTGAGLAPLAPVRLDGKSLRLEFLQGEGKPLVLRPDAGRGPAAAAMFSVENARFDLIGARIQATPSRIRNVPPRLLSIHNGSFTLRHCWLEGALHDDAPEEPLIDWAPGVESPEHRYAYITNVLLLGNQPLLGADVDHRLLVVDNSILASGRSCLVLRSQAGGATIAPADAGWVVLRHCSFLLGTEGIHLTGLTRGRSTSAVHVDCAACLFAPAPGADLALATVLTHPEEMTPRNLYEWWGFRCGYAASLQRYRQTPKSARGPQDFFRDWTEFWGADHVEAPVTGQNGVLFKTVLTSLDAVAPAMLELMPTCAAARAAADGGPIGARIGQVGPIGVPLVNPASGAPTTPSRNGSPGRIDF